MAAAFCFPLYTKELFLLCYGCMVLLFFKIPFDAQEFPVLHTYVYLDLDRLANRYCTLMYLSWPQQTFVHPVMASSCSRDITKSHYAAVVI